MQVKKVIHSENTKLPNLGFEIMTLGVPVTPMSELKSSHVFNMLYAGCPEKLPAFELK